MNGLRPVGGNSAELMHDSNAGIDSMVADMDAATDHIHLIFYIWLEDNNGLKVVEALKRAALRGVACRAMADGLGSRAMIKSEHWKAMRDTGVQVAVALSVKNPLLRPFDGRIDLLSRGAPCLQRQQIKCRSYPPMPKATCEQA